jgi:hypothetical protein
VIEDPCFNAVAIASQSKLVKLKKRNSTVRKAGALKNSVMLSASRKVATSSSLPSWRSRTADSRFGSVVKAEHNAAAF